MLSGSTGSPQEVLVEILARQKSQTFLQFLLDTLPAHNPFCALYFRRTTRSALRKLKEC